MLNFLSENMVVLTLACLAWVIFLVIVFESLLHGKID